MSNIAQITFIVPCYNQATFLDEALETVINQTYKDWKCIIVNDGSTDHTEEIAQNWVNKDNRFSYLYKTNGGLSSARNAGINLSNTTYIFPFDSDDKLVITYLEKAMPILLNDECIEVLSCRVRLFGVRNEEFVLPEYSFKQLLLRNCFIACSIFKLKTFKKVGGYDENLKSFEDWDFWISVLKEKGKHYKINELLYFYRKHQENSLSNRFYKDQDFYLSLYDYVYTKHIKLYKEYFPNFILLYNDYLLLESFNNKVKRNFIFKMYVKAKQFLKLTNEKVNKK
ncbi:glycosyltransferase family 2 protein [Bizionia saleffrena]|uniref:Glycosyltransferase family 2 protein n=1 Tax=Bizionia saleffrena TaxID=291189 RepID=A0A8H2LGK5_9FLAO|nr:glycosyltransferase family A protein [Bizionia saleffrena]TYB80169.1 glycosyltransferase family 2 protein [Bizionia saleffrena]